ncbi:BH3-interacting domain death agonist [Dermochelys coriacea]|uniref:BH3-interacting domain death agonist n=1 Tax=Dermochelys coriacea TaxID=27794 RepID=UPI0018E73D33|nr:BH3-interacting domain death agonist [Dermochelys coriacea]XP_038268082.1 BH3-interacting domain death agonist [Dermochelys coriacea]XP_038268091.1 BH3-interacting domain death agonist [Dermochelys coriacea]XP_038268102.1 BH3-interacting domain death agonist [Dermochelys coriacea]XP_038268112.1 BH3-interacting domain death agonist [Dermochelys coriacea]XP_043373588.1 BH3-interacting domain death agonist [Dermochelys coriacea]XP_043373616.1 BH3-interacting domain death agonist [Dermochelys 
MDQGLRGDVQMERILVYSFLQNCHNCDFREELDSLRSQVMVSPPKNFLSDEFDDGELQTDGNRSGRFSNGEPDSVVDEDIFRLIGAQLAEIGDQVAREIQPRVVNDLVQQFVNENLSKEEIMRRLSNTVEGLVRTIPLEMEQEKAMLVLAMVLARTVANKMPSLLHRVFNTTVNYINQNLHNYVVNLG